MKYSILSMIVLLLTANAVQAEVRIITNPSVKETTLSSSDIRDIFLGKKKKWSDNTKIHIVVADDDNLHASFLETYIHRTSNQFQAYWKNMVFTGKGAYPKTLKTTREIMDYIARTRGAVGYIKAGSPAIDVNTISVER